MPTVEDAYLDQSQLQGALDAGVDTISSNQSIVFVKYVRMVLPLDGFVFWVNAKLLSPSAMLNVMQYNKTVLNLTQTSNETTCTAQGSLHYATSFRQVEDETVGVNQVVFTSEGPVQDLDAVGNDVLYIGSIDEIRFAFSERRSFYRQAGLWHYTGTAIYPALETQVIDSLADFQGTRVVVSNSLPIWLGLNGANPWMKPFYPSTLTGYIPLYPSFLVPDNIQAPYGSVHIPPENTEALQAFPTLSRDRSTHRQLCKDRVRITFYGLRNFNVMDWLDYVLWYSQVTSDIGIMNMPVVRDEKRVQPELSVIAMKKTIEFEVSYYQERVRDVARKLITECIPTFHLL